MMSSFASDRSSELALQLKCSPSLLNHAPRQPDLVANLKQQVISSSKKSSSNPHEAQSKLSSLLGAVDLRDRFERKRVPNKQLLTALESLILSVQSSGNRAEDGEDVAEIRSILLIQIVLRSYSTLFESLCHQSFGIKDQIDYWSMIENNRISTVYYLIQSIPLRSIALASQIWAQTRRAIDQLREDEGHHNRNRLSTWAGQLYNQAWARPHQAISFSSLFPILSTNSRLLINSPSHSIQFLSTLSPILLTRQEARVKRQALELVHADLAEKIGGLVNGLHSLEDQAQRPAESDIALSGLVSKMCLVASDLDSQAQQPMDRDNPASMIDQLHQLLSSHLPNHPESLKLRISSLSPPGFFVRNWPWLVSLPVFSYALSSLAYSYRSKILDGFRDAKETLKGFISGWVIRPVEDILQTLRAGQEGTLAIMTKDSLAPELDSLERMVVEFGRDKLKWSEEELSKLSESVKEGNLTSVLKVWEQEIKAPIRSAIAGSLIRVLLIQIQKVKVDLSLAMDGIQSVLRSQSLTFGAIGVAPSMLICFMFGKLFGSLIRQRIGVVGKGTEAVRKEVRIAMRRMERTLLLITSNPSADSDHPTAKSHSNNPERTLGLLFLDLHLLRYFVHSPHFPRRESSRAIQQEFLADIKDLESSQLSWKTKSKLAKRFVKQWGFLVGI
ncbi:Nuclear control of ATPase protein 2 [Puccinia graminis f. sp. tritici]|uniref:Nuclear control of ATPase protein 2 n=1 Tax=Puccinia graminis f. sp. tritici TaxID=56615 RepID=A0A5B0LRP3_PUCGR|nr:Nuclear control of ATPase protein 2 [Puccinia graminis f. sp. tritici]KAA1083854.1 Nuclear control of ATPase protein 2 [Puccinia graminis f. sp. tritici]